MKEARIISLDSGVYTVLTKDNEELLMKARGKFRKTTLTKDSKFNKSNSLVSSKIDTKQVKLSPKVGDIVLYSKNDDTYVIEEILERKNELIRPNIANVDQILLIFALKRPDFSFYLLDLFIANLESNKVKPLIIITKTDLVTEEELQSFKEQMQYYEEIGYKVFYINSKKESPDEIKPYLKDKVTVLSGQTGAGKSTFINALIPGFKLDTNDISEALGRGKHTTRRSNLYPYFGGLVGDTPGFSKIELMVKKDELKNAFVEFGKCFCKFKDCNHLKNTPGCGVLEEVGKSIKKSRYDNYIKLFEGDNKYDN